MTQLINVDPPKRLQAMALEEIAEFKNAVDVTIRKFLVQGTDYAPMPGKNGGPNVLLKPGAEKLCAVFGLAADYEIIDKTIDHAISLPFQTRYKNGEAIGLYRYVIKCHLRDRGGNHVVSAIGLCSSVESKYCDRPRDLENTILKMAEKRALVAAVLNGLAISGIFTQDVEDTETPVRPAAPRQPQNYQKPQPAQPAPVTRRAFDKNNKAHQDYFMKEIERYDVPFDRIDDVAAALHGRPSSELAACIKETVGGDAKDIVTHAAPMADHAGVSETL